MYWYDAAQLAIRHRGALGYYNSILVLLQLQNKMWNQPYTYFSRELGSSVMKTHLILICYTDTERGEFWQHQTGYSENYVELDVVAPALCHLVLLCCFSISKCFPVAFLGGERVGVC